MERKLGIREAAEYTGFETRDIARAAKANPPRLIGYKTSEFGPWRFTRADLDVWVESMQNARTSVAAGNLRHTFATLALDAGHDYREVSEWLGHADYTTTLRTYAHWLPGEAKNSMQLPTEPAPAPEVSSNVVDLASRRRNVS